MAWLAAKDAIAEGRAWYTMDQGQVLNAMTVKDILDGQLYVLFDIGRHSSRLAI